MHIDAQQAFLSILEKVRAHAHFAFRRTRSFHEREDRIAETLALVFAWTSRLSQRGKDVRAFPTAIAAYATRAVKSGRKLCSNKQPRDPLCPLAQARHAFVCGCLPAHETESGNPL